MTQQVHIVVPGEPVAKGRPQMTIRGRRPVAFTPEKTREFEKHVANCARKAMNWGVPIEGPVSITVTAYVSPPEKFSKKDLLKRRCASGEVRPAVKPDADNFLKAALDGINGIAIVDDGQAVDVTARKFYDTSPRLEIVVQSLQQEQSNAETGMLL